MANLGITASLQGDYETARAELTKFLHRVFRQSNRFGCCRGLLSFSLLARCKGQPRRSALLAGAEHRVRGQIEHGVASFIPDYAGHLEELKRLLGSAAFDDAWAQGQHLTLEQAVDLALEDSEANG